MKEGSRLDHWFNSADDFEQYVGSLFGAEATLNLYRISGNRYRAGIWVHLKDGFSLPVDSSYLHGLSDGLSYRLSRVARQQIEQSWEDDIAWLEQAEDDYADYLDTGMAAMRGVL